MATGQAGDASLVAPAAADRNGPRQDDVVTPPDVRDRLNQLRDSVHSTLHHEFGTLAGDLDQLRGILSDAAAKLSEAFCHMTVGSTALLRLLDGAPDRSEANSLKDAASIARDISSRTVMTVQSLQFEDMATQLLQHVDRRLAMLEVFSKEMAVLRPDPAGRMVPLTEEALEDLFRLLERHRADLASVGRKSVQQQSMDSGVVELF